VDFVGLEWDSDRLKFHETKRQVRTASVSQVREPIYKTSVAKQRNYDCELAPFIDEIACLAPSLVPAASRHPDKWKSR
jgi:hypothetical protein